MTSASSTMACIKLTTFILFVVATYACTPEPWPTYHYWREPTPGLNRYIRTSGTDLSYEIYDDDNDNEFWYVTTFHDCGGQVYISTRAQASLYNVGNDGSGASADLLIAVPGSFGSYDSPFLFQYGGGAFMDSVTLSSHVPRQPKYVYGGNPNSIRFRTNPQFWWWTVPYVTSSFDGRWLASGGRTSAIMSSLTINNIAVQVAVNVVTSPTPDRLRVEAISSTSSGFQFNRIKYRIYTEPAYGGRVAIVLRSNPRDYLAVDITTDGVVRTPLIHRSSGLRYGIVRLVSYDDVARSQNSTFLKADIAQQTVIDERFFEVLVPPRNKTARLRTMLNKDLYLAVAQFTPQRKQLIIAPLSSLPPSIINYDFQLSNTDPPTRVRRLPVFRQNNLGSRPTNVRRTN